MRIAALYDIHGNLPALDAVLAEVHRLQCDRIVVGGDVYPGPLAALVLSRLQSSALAVDFIRGNGESAIVAYAQSGSFQGIPAPAHDAVKWHMEQSSDTEIATLAAWPQTLEFTLSELGRILFCHATPRNDTEIFTELTSASILEPIFSATGANVVVCGHTHMQFDRQIGDVRVLNAGSVGMPFGHSAADWLLIDGEVQLMRTSYEIDAAIGVLVHSGFPDVSTFLERLRAPVAAAAVVEAYSKMEIRS